MEKCQECNLTIYNSRRYRELKEQLVKLDKRYESIVDSLCQDCLQREINKHLRSQIREKLLETFLKKNKKRIENLTEEL